MRRWIERMGLVRGKPVEPWLPDGVRVYCIGDVHGRDDLLRELCGRIVDDASGHGGHSIAVFLGDYVDRGPGSKGVVNQLLSDPLPGLRSVFLRGNHEQAMLDFLEYPPIGEMWLTFGGHATVNSYGVTFDRLPSRTRDFERLSASLRDALPSAHARFLNETTLYFDLGNYFFCHAGIRPGVSVDRQTPEDLLWIREEFTESRRHHERIVVHGHTVTNRVEFLPNRIGIDTGAHDSGILTCLVLEGEQRRLIQT